MTSHRLIPIICCLLVPMLYIVMMSDNTEAQLSPNKLDSIANQTNVLTTAGVVVGDGPSYFEANFENEVYVANSDSDTVSVIDPVTNNVIDTIAVGDRPSFIYFVFGGEEDAIYVANEDSDTVSVIDPVTNNVTDTITVGDRPRSIHTLYADAIYVANEDSDTVSVINATTKNVTDTIAVGNGPNFIWEAGGPGEEDAIYVANRRSDTVSVINATTNNVTDTITVGNGPKFIYTSGEEDAIYVANRRSDTVSVINATTNNVTDTITVGYGPNFIHSLIGGEDNAIYVANQLSDSVSVIDPVTNNVTDTIAVGNGPNVISDYYDAIYVANEFSDTVSVIDPVTKNVTDTITVGDLPIFVSNFGDAIYVANHDSGTVSVIDPSINEVMAGITLNIIPFRGGQINCNGLNAPINRYFYASTGTECVAKSKSGFEFDSWVEMFDDNSTRTINASTTSDWLVDPVAAFHDAFTDDPAATLTVDRFGSFTAYFRALPPPVPAEFTFSLITIIVTALVGSLLIPAAVSWSKSKKQTSRLNSFHQQMATVYADGKIDENDVNKLDELNKNISDSYSAGKITNDQYTSLKNEVSAAYQKIFKKIIESVAGPNTEDVNKIKNDIEDAYSDRKITELDYNLLNGKISRILGNKSDIK